MTSAARALRQDEAPVDNRRRFPRYATDLPVRFWIEQGKGWKQGRLLDLGMGGLRLELPRMAHIERLQVQGIHPEGVMSPVSILLELPVPEKAPRGTAFRVSGCVLWDSQEPGVFYGIQFEDLDDDKRYLLVDLIALLLTTGKARSQSTR